MRIDLHTHSNVSDGTSTPTELVQEAVAAGLDMVAITDHDTTASWPEAAAAARAAGIALVRGTEVSARAERTPTGHGFSIHLLSYLQDETEADLDAELTRIRQSRDTRAQAMVEQLAKDFPITWEEVVAVSGGALTYGRPHIADALVAKGLFPDRPAAFASALHPASPYYVRHYSPDAADAIALILGAGGVPVFAHPGADKRGRIVTDETIAELAAAGLAGLEVDHRDHDEFQRARLRSLAADLGLFITGSSDYHGSGKVNRLGEHVTAPEVAELIASRGYREVV